ncbi:MAG: hypothetical protein ABSC94_31545 [Polyangiaceae bacterium]|jgi:hypothetical protein
MATAPTPPCAPTLPPGFEIRVHPSEGRTLVRVTSPEGGRLDGYCAPEAVSTCSAKLATRAWRVAELMARVRGLGYVAPSPAAPQAVKP